MDIFLMAAVGFTCTLLGFSAGRLAGKRAGVEFAIRLLDPDHIWETSVCADPDCEEPADPGHEFCALCEAEIYGMRPPK